MTPYAYDVLQLTMIPLHGVGGIDQTADLLGCFASDGNGKTGIWKWKIVIIGITIKAIEM